MSYVLSIIQPPEGGAAYGKALVSVPRSDRELVALFAVAQLTLEGVPRTDAALFALGLLEESERLGTEVTHTGTGLTFRIDDADTPPNVCPCCSRLVKPEDAMFAGMDDTLCDGCYTWHRTTPQCLPANTAHPTKEFRP